MRTPFAAPNSSPIPTPAMIETPSGIPPFACARSAATTPAIAITEPTDKSIPPVMSTSVIPIASVPVIVT